MKRIVLLLLLLAPVSSIAQSKFQKAIDRDFGTNNSIGEYGHDIQQTTDGGYIVSGYSDNYGIGTHDVFLVRLDQYGDTVWSRLYGTVQEEHGQKVVQTSDGGFAVAGYTTGAGAGQKDIFLMKTDLNGSLLWSKTFGSAEDEELHGIEETADNGFVLVGQSVYFEGGWDYEDVLVIKTDANGDTTWTKIYAPLSDGDDVIGRDITQTSDGGYAIIGSDGAFSGGAFLMKLTASGDTSWVKSYAGSGIWPEGYSVQETSDGGYVIGGRTFTGGFGAADWVMIKTNPTGDVQWSSVYGAPGSADSDYLIEAFEVASGGYFMGGTFTNNSIVGVTAIKTNSVGTIDWSKAYANQYGSFYGYNGYYGFTECSDGGFAMTAELSNQFGNTLDELYNGTDMLVIKTDSLGDSYGCQQIPLSVLEQALTLSEYAAPFEDSSGVTVNTNVFSEQSSITTIMHAGIKMYMNASAVTCGGTCDGTIEANPCDPGGFYCSGANPYSYAWDDALAQSSITATGLCTGTYTVTVTDAYGCWGIDSVTLSSSAPAQALCLVTVDSTSSHNLLSWEKPATTGIDSFKVYRLIAGSGYTWIGSVAYDSLSQFVDTTNGINPNTTSYRYKISTLDTCGNESVPSAFHETIHLTSSQGAGSEINLVWDNYVGDVDTFFYRILRDTSGVGNWEVIDSVPETNFTYTDQNPIPNITNVYMIEVVPPYSCTSTKAVNYSSSRSNKPSSVGPTPQLNANFLTAATSIMEGQSITFSDMSSGSPTGWEWYFEGATPSSSTNQNPSGIAYNTSGTYDVELIVFDGTSSDTLLQTDYMTVLPNNGQAPVANFIASATAINVGDAVNFTDLSSNTPTSWSWVFSNGTPSASTDQNPQNIVYNTAGTFDVSLIVSNVNGNNAEVRVGYITVSDPSVGIGYLDDKDGSFSLYPNPNNGRFTIQSHRNNWTKITILNALGQLILEEQLAPLKHKELNLNTSGVYMIVATQNNTRTTQKIVVK